MSLSKRSTRPARKEADMALRRGWGQSGRDAPLLPGALCGFWFSDDAELLITSVDGRHVASLATCLDSAGELCESTCYVSPGTTRILFPS